MELLAYKKLLEWKISNKRKPLIQIRSLKPVRFSMSNYREQDWMVNVPLALAGEWIDAAE